MTAVEVSSALAGAGGRSTAQPAVETDRIQAALAGFQMSPEPVPPSPVAAATVVAESPESMMRSAPTSPLSTEEASSMNPRRPLCIHLSIAVFRLVRIGSDANRSTPNRSCSGKKAVAMGSRCCLCAPCVLGCSGRGRYGMTQGNRKQHVRWENAAHTTGSTKPSTGHQWTSPWAPESPRPVSSLDSSVRLHWQLQRRPVGEPSRQGALEAR